MALEFIVQNSKLELLGIFINKLFGIYFSRLLQFYLVDFIIA